VAKRLKNNSVAIKLGLKDETVDWCIGKWNQPHRFYHSIDHLYDMFIYFETKLLAKNITEREKELLDLAALFHDVCFDPHSNEIPNEFASIDFMESRIRNFNKDSEIIKGLIHSTLYLEESCDKYRNGKLYEIFSAADLDYILKGTYSEVLENEHKMIKEYQCYPYRKYCEGRLEFLRAFAKKYGKTDTLEIIDDFLNTYVPKVGVYPGSFSPFHIGHLNILEQAEKIFDKVIIAIGDNPEKNNSTSISRLKTVLPFHEIDTYHGLLSDYLKTLEGYADVTVIRGLRNSYDLIAEENNLRILRDCGCEAPVIYLMCGKEFQHISSSMVRGMDGIARDFISRYLPKKYDYMT
jgi:pantetheine-phosphate adenylyltransferase